MGASMKCTFGTAPSTLIVIDPTVMGGGKPAANIMHHKPMASIPPFGTCSSMANPAATSAALGVLTPMPCVPVIAAP